jgi:hypothetical protein
MITCYRWIWLKKWQWLSATSRAAPFAVTSFSVRKHYSAAPEIAAQYRRQLKARISAANLFKPMCAALESARAEQGKQTQQRHYSNESNMIARIVLGGMTAKQWAQENGITGEPRDSMNAAQLEHLAYLESTNITLIELGQDYDQRKAELIRLSQRWLAKRMG